MALIKKMRKALPYKLGEGEEVMFHCPFLSDLFDEILDSTYESSLKRCVVIGKWRRLKFLDVKEGLLFLQDLVGEGRALPERVVNAGYVVFVEGVREIALHSDSAELRVKQVVKQRKNSQNL